MPRWRGTNKLLSNFGSKCSGKLLRCHLSWVLAGASPAFASLSWNQSGFQSLLNQPNLHRLPDVVIRIQRRWNLDNQSSFFLHITCKEWLMDLFWKFITENTHYRWRPTRDFDSLTLKTAIFNNEGRLFPCSWYYLSTWRPVSSFLVHFILCGGRSSSSLLSFFFNPIPATALL